MVATYKDLDVYRRAFKAMIMVYKKTADLPTYLQFDIGNDIRRAARSVSSNICEGYSRNKSKKDIVNFLRTSQGSNEEVLFNLEILNELNFLQANDFLILHEEFTIVGKQLHNLIVSLK